MKPHIALHIPATHPKPVGERGLSVCLASLATLAANVAPLRTATGADESPASHLPPHIQRVTWFGERADWSHDGNRILFLTKTFGDALEIDLETKVIRNLTAHYPHPGYTRALYLSNGDILLSGPAQFDPKNVGEARTQCFLFVLDKSLTRPPVPLGTKCSEGPAVSRRRLHIAWTHVAAEYPDEMPAGSSRMQEADIVYEDGKARLASQKLILESGSLPFVCTLETQNFRPPLERELTFSAYALPGHGRLRHRPRDEESDQLLQFAGTVRRARRNLPRRTTHTRRV